VIRFLGVAALGLALVPTALASGPPLNAQQGGPGLLSPDGKLRFVAIGDGQHTTVESIRTRDGVVWESLNLGGAWGLPTLA
jgi:hypothetical protein